jgi:HEAT repeat protein
LVSATNRNFPTNRNRILRSINVYRKIALQDETQTVKEAGILALGQLLRSQFNNEALDILAELAQDADWRTRWRVAIALQHSQQSPAKELIAKLQQDEHYRVVAAALEVAASWENT